MIPPFLFLDALHRERVEFQKQATSFIGRTFAKKVAG